MWRYNEFHQKYVQDRLNGREQETNKYKPISG